MQLLERTLGRRLAGQAIKRTLTEAVSDGIAVGALARGTLALRALHRASCKAPRAALCTMLRSGSWAASPRTLARSAMPLGSPEDRHQPLVRPQAWRSAASAQKVILGGNTKEPGVQRNGPRCSQEKPATTARAQQRALRSGTRAASPCSSGTWTAGSC